MAIYGTIVPNFNTSFRNLLINGDMSVWQKGTSGNTSGASVVSDMFSIESRNSTTINWAQSTDVPAGEGFSYSMRIYATNSTDDGCHWKKAVELGGTGNYSKFAAGKKFVLSYWAKSAYSNRTINPTLLLSNSTTGHTAYSQSVTSNEGTATLTTTWQKFTHTYTMPTWTADTGSLSNVTMLYIRFLQGSDNTSQDTYITGIQFEEGTVATPFEFRPIQTETALCQRYYFRVVDTDGVTEQIVMWGLASNSAQVNFVPPVVPMFGRPSVSITNTAPYWESSPWGTAGVSSSGVTVTNGHFGRSGYDILVSGTFNPTLTRAINYTIEANIFILSSEL